MAAFDDLLAAIKTDEGFRAKPYHCPAGKLTIGYGRNIEDNGISEAEAETMLTSDVIRAMTDAADLVPNWFALNPVRRNVVSNMAFNMGKTRLAGFKKFLAALDAGDWALAADEMKGSAWYWQVVARAKRLEAEMRTGVA